MALTKPNGKGAYTLTVTSGLPKGDNTLTVVYSGDKNYAGSTTTFDPDSETGSIPTTTVLSFHGGTQSGLLVFLNAEVVGSDTGSMLSDGTVTFFDGTTNLGTVAIQNQNANLDVPLTLGGHVFTAVYNGDATYSSSTSTPVDVSGGPSADSLNITAVYSTPANQPYSVIVQFYGFARRKRHPPAR